MAGRKYQESWERWEDPEWCAKWDSHPFLGEFVAMCQDTVWALQEDLADPVFFLKELGFSFLCILDIWLFFVIFGA